MFCRVFIVSDLDLLSPPLHALRSLFEALVTLIIRRSCRGMHCRTIRVCYTRLLSPRYLDQARLALGLPHYHASTPTPIAASTDHVEALVEGVIASFLRRCTQVDILLIDAAALIRGLLLLICARSRCNILLLQEL